VREGVVVLAEAQSRGRGRLGRKWTSPAGKGLWFSVLLRPDMRPQAVTQLTVAAATALARAVRQHTGLTPEIKWPNDILLRGRKLAGILTELSAELDQVKHVILGIGLNVNLAASDFPPDLRKLATSLLLETGKPQRRADVAAAILRELDRDYGRLRQRRFAELAGEWAAQCTTIGRRVRIQLGPHVVEGLAEALNEDGALLLRTEHGHLEAILSGDVTLLKPER
jgi:BirA family biotin operon repressor/biotin-[acetyl-CoA-carboxylase] ligase